MKSKDARAASVHRGTCEGTAAKLRTRPKWCKALVYRHLRGSPSCGVYDAYGSEGARQPGSEGWTDRVRVAYATLTLRMEFRHTARRQWGDTDCRSASLPT